MSPGTYITQQRIAAGMSVEDVALCLDSDPPVSARRRGELLTSIELDVLRVRFSTIRALAVIPQLAINGQLLATLVDDWGDRHSEPASIRFVAARTLDETR